MGTCNIDHSLEDVRTKLESQKDFLPNDLYEGTKTFLTEEVIQPVLNEIFHLLKKYDLVDLDEQQQRIEKLRDIVK